MEKVIQLRLANLAGLLIVFLVNSSVYANNYKITVFYPSAQHGVKGIGAMLESSIASVQSPDFDVNYVKVDTKTWPDESSLADFLVDKQKDEPADGIFIACHKSVDAVGKLFRKTFPKVPYVDSFAPALMAANVVSYRYAVLTGTKEGASLVRTLITDLGTENHVRMGGSSLFRDSFLVMTEPYNLNTTKSEVVPDIVTLGLATTGSDKTDLVVTNAEAIVLAGCEGFLDIGVASDAQKQLTSDDSPLQVINPIKASMGLLYSMIRNKVWITE